MKKISELIKQYLSENLREGDNKTTVHSNGWRWELSTSVSTGLDEEAMKKDGVYDKYHTLEKVSQRLTVKEDKEK